LRLAFRLRELIGMAAPAKAPADAALIAALTDAVAASIDLGSEDEAGAIRAALALSEQLLDAERRGLIFGRGAKAFELLCARALAALACTCRSADRPLMLVLVLNTLAGLYRHVLASGWASSVLSTQFSTIVDQLTSLSDGLVTLPEVAGAIAILLLNAVDDRSRKSWYVCAVGCQIAS